MRFSEFVISIYHLSLGSAIAPVNKFLSNSSPWPMAHHDSYFQASTSLRGPGIDDAVNYKMQIDTLFGKTTSGTLMLFYTSDKRIVWGSSSSSIYKLDRINFKIIDAIAKPKELAFRDTFKGIYSFVSQYDIFYSAIDNVIISCGSENSEDLSSNIKPLGKFVFELAVEDESIVSLSMLYSGYIAFLTNRGTVGILTQDLTQLVALTDMNGPLQYTLDNKNKNLQNYSDYYLSDFWNKMNNEEYKLMEIISENKLNETNSSLVQNDGSSVDSEMFLWKFRRRINKNSLQNYLVVSNAMCNDEFDGLYVVSSDFIHRVWFDSKNKKIFVKPPPEGESDSEIPSTCDTTRYNKHHSAPPCTVWTSRYFVDPNPIEDRISKRGSGTSPTLMRVSDSHFVAIADGGRKQKIVIFDAFNGSVSAEALATYGLDLKGDRFDAYTEQTLVVHGSDLLIVQNALTSTGRKFNNLLRHWNADDFAREHNLPTMIVNNIFSLPIVLGDAPVGLEKFSFDPFSSFEKRLESKWTNSESGCPNSIPSMSSSSGLFYCVSKGQRYRNIPYMRRMKTKIDTFVGRGLQSINNNSSTDIDSQIPGDSSSFNFDDKLDDKYFDLRNKTAEVLTGRFSIPRMVDTISIATYPLSGGFDGFWTISAFNWTTGQKVFDYRTGSDLRYNTLYAATQIGLDKEIIHGCIGGLVRLSSRKSD